MLFPLLLIACEQEPPTAKIIEVNKRMPLEEWPDSNYIASLDSILALEPIKKDSKDKPNIAMNVFKAPVFKLPTSQPSGKKEKGTSARKDKRVQQQAPKAHADNSAEVFMEKFSNALARLQSDPSNSSLYKVVQAKDGEDLFKLLRRTYGAGAQKLPRFYVLSALQSVNPGVRLEHLTEGANVRVPRI